MWCSCIVPYFFLATKFSASPFVSFHRSLERDPEQSFLSIRGANIAFYQFIGLLPAGFREWRRRTNGCGATLRSQWLLKRESNLYCLCKRVNKIESRGSLGSTFFFTNFWALKVVLTFVHSPLNFLSFFSKAFFKSFWRFPDLLN